MIREFKFKIDWLLWFLIICPIFYVAGFDLRQSQAMFFQYSAIALLAVMHVNKWLGGLLAWALFQSIFFKFTDEMTMMYLFFGLLIYQFIVIFSNHNEIGKYSKTIFFVLLLNVFWCFLQMKQIDPLLSITNQDKQTLFTEYSGLFALPAFLGNYAAVALSLTISWFVWAVPVVFLGLFFSKSTFSMVAGYVSMLFYLWFRKRILFWIVLGVSTVLLSAYIVKVDMPTGQFERRTRIWKVILQSALATPLTGHGIGVYKKITFATSEPLQRVVMTTDSDYLKKFLAKEAFDFGKPELANKLMAMDSKDFGITSDISKLLQSYDMDIKHWANAHNEFLEAFFELGGIGMFFIFGYIITTFKRFLDGENSEYCLGLMSAFIAILIVSFGHFPFHLARLAGTFVSVMALLEVCLNQKKKVISEAW